MNNYITAKTIKSLREENKLTQQDLAEILSVSDKTISKWETGRGLPDITLIEPLANALFVSVAELMTGECIINKNKSGNMSKCKFYVCPICGNIFYSMGESAISCCGVSLPPLEVEEGDEKHIINIEKAENESFVTINHPMTKDHYILFLAKVNSDRVEIVKLYAEGNAETRFFNRGNCTIFAYCNKHGLFKVALHK